MVGRRNGEFKRSVLSALAAVIAASVPSLITAPARAEAKAGSAAAREEQGKAAKTGKSEDRQARKAHAAKGQKPHGTEDAKAKADKAPGPHKADAAPADGKSRPTAATAATAASKGKKTKKTASRGTSARAKKTGKKAEAEAPRRACVGAPVTVDRGGLEGETFPLLDCHGAPLEAARAELSLLSRPWSVARPKRLSRAPARAEAQAAKKGPAARGHVKPAVAPGEIAPGVRMVDPGLLTRLDAISHKFQGHPISLVSGYRPQSRGSQHQSGRALDLRVAGVSNEDLVAFCRTLTDTGCGYYPNSSFVHVDVRNPGTGSIYWIDASGPGEPPRYVPQWPPPREDIREKPAAAGDAEPHDGTKDPWQLDPTTDDDAASDDDASDDDASDDDASDDASEPAPLQDTPATPATKPIS